jgi:RNA polymerase sigma factor (sigma-70 family)
MLPSPEPTTFVSAVRKLTPQVKLPAGAVLRTFSTLEQQLLRRRLTEIVECVYDPAFELAECAARYGAPLRPAGQANAVGNDDSGVDLLAEPNERALSHLEERHLFLRLNYCRFRVMKIVREFAGKPLTAEATRDLLEWEGRAVETRCEIVRSNVPLVLAMAKRTKLIGVDFADLVSEGNLALLRSVDKFDCSRGFKFSTYACRAILKSFSRVASRSARYRGHFPTEFDPTLEKGDFVEQKRLSVEDDCVDELRTILGANMANLNEVEQCVIRARFALDGQEAETSAPRAKTLEQVGEMIGVTKERVRQIQNKALTKLRMVLEGGVLAV